MRTKGANQGSTGQIATAATPPSDPCDITVGGGLLYPAAATAATARFTEGIIARLDTVGWAMVMVAEVELLQCLCLLWKGLTQRTQRRGRASSAFREPSI